ncbi:MAG: hypothetical protein ACXU82_03935 [Caulobacteraceae bacterium]
MGVILWIWMMILLPFIPAIIAQRKGESLGLWWFLGLLIFPVALTLALMMKPSLSAIDRVEARRGLVQCPTCFDWIRPQAKACGHCGRDITPA